MTETSEATPTLEFLIGELEHIFDDLAATLDDMDKETRELRERFRQARETLDETGSSISVAEAELDGLPTRMAHADLRGDEQEKQRLRDRYAELQESIEASRERRQEALEVFRHGDPWQAQSAAFQAAAGRADAVVRDAEAQRAALLEALDKAFRGLDERANRVRQYRRTHNSLRGALNHG